MNRLRVAEAVAVGASALLVGIVLGGAQPRIKPAANIDAECFRLFDSSGTMRAILCVREDGARLDFYGADGSVTSCVPPLVHVNAPAPEPVRVTPKPPPEKEDPRLILASLVRERDRMVRDEAVLDHIQIEAVALLSVQKTPWAKAEVEAATQKLEDHRQKLEVLEKRIDKLRLAEADRKAASKAKNALDDR